MFTYYLQRGGPSFRKVLAILRRDNRGNAHRWNGPSRTWVPIDVMTILDAERAGDPTLDRVPESSAKAAIAASV